jgi:hypothetical protein
MLILLKSGVAAYAMHKAASWAYQTREAKAFQQLAYIMISDMDFGFVRWS